MHKKPIFALVVLAHLHPSMGHAVELADLVRHAVTSGITVSGKVTGKSAERIIEITKAHGDMSATAEVLGPLPAGNEVCRHVRVVFYLANVETRDGTLVPYTQTLTMPWCPSEAGYLALKGTPGLFHVGR